MLGVLIEILCLDSVAVHRRFSGECKVALIIPMCVPARAILALPAHRIAAAGRRLSSLRPRVPASGSVHSVISREVRAKLLRACTKS